jgi:amino acid transporter
MADQVETPAELEHGALGFVSSVAVGVASTTPGVSAALVFGLLAAGVGVHMPATIILGFLPILLISGAYLHLNRANPDCGTVFAWASRAFGPWVGWFGGWLVIASLALVVANFAQLLGTYSFLLVGWDSAAGSTVATTVVGTIWFAILTVIAYRGVELSSKVQMPMLAVELVIFVGFAIVAIVRAQIDGPAGSVTPALSWFSPSGVSIAALSAGFVSAALIFWGWDTTVMLNEETEHSTRTPGRAAVVSTILLLGFYVIVAVGVLAWAGPQRLAENPDDIIGLLGPEVLGGTLSHLLVFAVLTSSIAGGVFLPVGAARTILSMSRAGALPASLAKIHPRFGTPSRATIVFAVISTIYYLVMTAVSGSILIDSLTALGLLVSMYYALTGLSCVVLYRDRLRKSVKEFLLLGLCPLLGAAALIYVMIRSAIDYADPVNSAGGSSLFGLGAPLVIALTVIVLGIAGAVWSWLRSKDFFQRGFVAVEA